jgi:hypothetical protein
VFVHMCARVRASAVVLALSMVFIWRSVPETKGRTIEEIQELISSGKTGDPQRAKLLQSY